jgi:hypothetical protein
MRAPRLVWDSRQSGRWRIAADSKTGSGLLRAEGFTSLQKKRKPSRIQEGITPIKLAKAVADMAGTDAKKVRLHRAYGEKLTQCCKT